MVVSTEGRSALDILQGVRSALILHRGAVSTRYTTVMGVSTEGRSALDILQ